MVYVHLSDLLRVLKLISYVMTKSKEPQHTVNDLNNSSIYWGKATLLLLRILHEEEMCTYHKHSNTQIKQLRDIKALLYQPNKCIGLV